MILQIYPLTKEKIFKILFWITLYRRMIYYKPCFFRMLLQILFVTFRYLLLSFL